MDTSTFYNKNESIIQERLNKLYYLRKKIEKKNKKTPADKYNNYLSRCNKLVKKNKKLLYEEFKVSKQKKDIRILNGDKIKKSNIISVFDSALTRTIGLNENELSDELIVVQTYFFDVVEDLILYGFIFNGNKYVCLTASAGQIRTKKTVFIKESTYTKHIKTITCGLTLDIINSKGGMNVNKYLAYLALSNSATDLWDDFDITKSIVVDDFETFVKSTVDFIDDETYEITRKEMDIPICHTDGCGMMLNGKTTMIRLPWVKGLMVVHPFDKFIKEQRALDNNSCGIIKDIYGKEHDVLKEGIKYIFTKSQFKMHNFYESWDDYIHNFKKYNCQVGICNEEDEEFNNAKINYQMLQTLIDMTDEELKKVARETKNDIYKLSTNLKTMLKVLGATKANYNKNYLQQALYIYPELLSDTYSKEVLKQVKKSLVKDGRSGRLFINGVYTFIIPDLYAFCEYLFLGDKNPKGLLGNGEVFCRLYENEKQLDCLRSPHLFLEHAVRTNIVDEKKMKWFISKGLYTSCHDPISKILQFDNDGDKSLICSDKTIINVAERNMKDIVPLYYNMRKAGAEIIDNTNIYTGLKTAYTGGNIGIISNDITKIWNSENVNLDVVKLLCMENNFTIDYAKTLYKPKRPQNKKKLITNYTKSKTPHFFIYAKDKDINKVEKINNSTVNRLHTIIPNPRLKFRNEDIGEFSYTNLMRNKNIELNKKARQIIEKYTELDLNKRFISMNVQDEESTDDTMFLYRDIRNQILEVNSDIYYVTDVLVKFLYEEKKSNYKTTLWSSFGDIIVENINNNIELDYGECIECGQIIRKTNNRIKYCTSCFNKKRRDYKTKKQREYRKNM